MNASDARRLEKIDELYRLRLDRQIALPQLIVAGDQSSGKSSVLEALTDGLPFPRDSGLCTRFPTQIVFKRSPSTKVEVSIISAQGEAGTTNFAKKELAALDHDQFLAIISEACACMGVPKPGEQSTGLKSFSMDMLKIELSKPSYEHFSVIDLPGLFRKPTPGQTTAEDIVLVRQMISTYIKNPRSIILAVVPANVDIATQEIIHMAEQADPGRKRTLGVLTKPDLVDSGAEDKVLQLLQHDSSNLGYAIVCNRSQKLLASDTEQRNAHERTFFEIDPWSKIPRDRVGITAVKKLFDNLLRSITRSNFDNVVHDIEVKLQEHLQEIERIGPARNDAASQRMYVLQLVSEYQASINAAIQSSYGYSSCFEDDDLRLSSLIISTSKEFAETMERNGFTRNFRSDHTILLVPDEDDGVESCPDDNCSEEEVDFNPTELNSLELFSHKKPKYLEENILTWIKREYQNYRSFGIGGMSPSLYRTLFKEHTKPWVVLAQQHINKTIVYIHRFLYKLLDCSCRDAAARDRIWERIVPSLLRTYQIAVQQLDFLLEVERDGNLGTLNHYLAENIQKSSEARALHRLRSLGTWKTDGTDGAEAQPLLRLSDVTKVWQSNEDHEIEDIHDTLESYCKVARKRFVDNVYMQVIDCLLITSQKSPLRILSSAWVGTLSDDDLANIAGEKESSRQRRKLLTEEIESLKKGLEILRR